MKESKDLLENVLSTKIDKRLILEELKSSNLPNVIYGKGDYANTLFSFLKSNNISIDRFLLNERYFDENSSVWNDIPVESIEKYDLINSNKYNLIIGFSDFLVALENLKSYKNIKQAYFFDSVSFFDFFKESFLELKWKTFYETYLQLEDDKSKQIMEFFIKGKLSSFPEELYELTEKNQYFPSELINLTQNEVFVDVGAYNGDTIIEFINKTNGRYSKIYAIEPDEKNFNDLLVTIKQNKYLNIETFNKGSWSEQRLLKFNSDVTSTVKSKFSNDGVLDVEVDSIDNITANNQVTYIKMDVEGSELETLKGAAETIKKWKPKLAVAIYHKQDDLIKLPQFIKELRPDYKLYLRHHMYITQELILYAI